MACYQEAVVSLFVRAQGVSKDDVVKVFGTDTVLADSAELCFITPAAKEKDLDQKLASLKAQIISKIRVMQEEE